MTAAFILGQNVNLAMELGMRMNAAGLGQNLSALNVRTGNTTKECTNVVAGLGIVEGLAEHFNTGADGLRLLVFQTNDFNFLTHLELSTLNTAGSNRTTAGNGEDVLNGHQEGQVSLTFRSRNVGVDGVKKVPDGLQDFSVRVAAVILKSLESGTGNDRNVVSREFVLGQSLTDFHFDELKQLGVVDLVNFVQENDDVRNADLTGKKQMLFGLSHGAVGSGNNKDSTVHLSGTSNHVFNIVSMAGAVDMGIVTAFDVSAVLGLILNVSGVDGDTTLSLFRSLVDGSIVLELGKTLHGEGLGDGSGQSGLTMVNVTNGTDVNMGFGSVKMFFCHWNFLLNKWKI